MAEAPRADLFARIRQGDAIAVHEFYRQTEPFLRGVARRLLNPALRRQVDSIDVTQSVFRRVLAPSSKSMQFDDETRFLGWLATIVRNRVRTLSRRTKGPGGGAWVAPEEQEVIALHDFEGMTFQQVADLLGRTSSEAVRKRHARALARLRKRIAPARGGGPA
ncbi:MAG: RNA polymerase sigma factor [Planctomycetota bacterium]